MKQNLASIGTPIDKDKTKKLVGGDKTQGTGCSGTCNFDFDCDVYAGCRCKYQPATGGGRSECYSLF